MRIVVPFGFYGWGNIGDESTLQGFARLVSRCPAVRSRVWVASRSPSHTARIEPLFGYYAAQKRNLRGWWARRRADAYVFAGGTPVMDILGSYPLADVVPMVATGAQRGKRILFVGIGTESLRREESRRAVAEVLAPKVHRWSVRSARDRERLAACGVPAASITVAADMAWLLDPVTPAWGREYLQGLGIDVEKPLIGVNVNAEPFMQREAPDLLPRIARFADELIEQHGATLLFLCNDASEGPSYDKAASAAVRAAMSHAERAFVVPNHYWSPQQMLSLIACCRATVSTRYHFCLFAALQGVPFIALQRSDKVEDLCLDLQWPHGVPIRAVEASALAALEREIGRDPRGWSERLRRASAEMRQRALANLRAFD
jgi:polysaccharide pyruvyl transferase WcaK-like protein